MTALTKYKIIFTAHGKTVATWDGYLSRREARSAIDDADLIIPMHWDYEITAYT